MKFNLPLFRKKEIKTYFLALLLRDEKLSVLILEEILGKLTPIAQNELKLTETLEKTSFEAWLEAIDRVISQTEASLDKKIDLHKTIFGLKESWTQEGKIKQEYSAKLKKISADLALEPIGFLVFSEAITHLLQQEEGAPISGILVDAGRKYLTVSLIRAGKLIQSQEGEIVDSLPFTVDNILKNFDSVEILPSRIILFEDDKQQAISQGFIAHSWSKSLPFLHVPQVTLLPAGFDLKAVLAGTATQMGFETLFNADLKTRQITTEDNFRAQEIAGIAKPNAVIPAAEPEMVEEDQASDFAFVKEQDIGQKPMAQETSNFSEVNLSSLVEEEIAEQEQQEVSASQVGQTFMANFFKNLNSPKIMQTSALFFRQIPALLRNGLVFLTQQFWKKKQAVSSQKPNKTKHNKILLVIFAGLILIGLILGWYILKLKATVTIVVNPKVLTQNQAVTFSTNSSTNVSSNIIAAQSVNVSEKGNLEEKTTGTKEVGTPAKGTVTIANLADAKTFASGTVITSSNGLKFTLDQTVSVASGSADPFNATAGKADVTVTASDIGTEYNLPANTKFSLGSSDLIAAKNSAPFTGGTKQEVAIFSKADKDKLIADLMKNLETKAKQDLQQNSTGGEIALPVLLEETPTATTFSKNIGDSATTVSLQGTFTYSSIAYQKKQLNDLTAKVLDGQLDEHHFTFSPEDITFAVGDIKIKDKNNLTASLVIKALLMPKIDTQQLAKNLQGVSFTKAENMVSSLPQFNNLQINLEPNLFLLPQFLPKVADNIKIVITKHE